MNLETIPCTEIPRLAREGRCIVDVRAPVEFAAGAIPGSENLPILNDEERARVGTVYKEQGNAAAVALGISLVAGSVKEERVRAWTAALAPENAIITCFRGGQRSQFAQRWCAEAGIRRPRLREGYKGARAVLRETVETAAGRDELILIGGCTGSGKSAVLTALKDACAIVDLEKHAEHRGSAFGGKAELQPSQTTFENRLAWELLREERPRFRVVEDESRLIGRLVVPEPFFAKMRSSPLVLIEESVARRARHILQDYVAEPVARGRNPFPDFLESLRKIQNRLGGARAHEIRKDMEDARDLFERNPRDQEANLVWISKLLEWYYDPMYLDSIVRREPHVLFRGSRVAATEYLRERR